MTFSTNPYCTLDQVRTALDLTKTSTDSFIQELIEEAQTFLDRKIGYPFQLDSNSSRLFDGNDHNTLLIGNCQSISEVLEMTYNVIFGSFGIYSSGTTQTINITADCVLAPANSLVNGKPFYQLKRKTGSTFLQGTQNYQITGNWGYDSVPADITRACTRLVTHWYKMRDMNYADVLNEQGAIRQKYEKKIPDDVMDIIEFYRRRNFLCR